MADVRGSGGIMLSQAEQGMKLFKAAEVGKVGPLSRGGIGVSTSRFHQHVELTTKLH